MEQKNQSYLIVFGCFKPYIKILWDEIKGLHKVIGVFIVKMEQKNQMFLMLFRNNSCFKMNG